MIRTNYGYRYEDGLVEGFSALRFNQKASEDACLALVKAQCEAKGQPYNSDRLIDSPAKAKGLSKLQRKQIKDDWSLVRNPGDPDPASGMIGFFG
jgi:hypothetical protein